MIVANDNPEDSLARKKRAPVPWKAVPARPKGTGRLASMPVCFASDANFVRIADERFRSPAPLSPCLPMRVSIHARIPPARIPSGAGAKKEPVRIGALVVGLIGGVASVAYGLLGYGLACFAESGYPASATGVKILSVVVPIAALLGAGMVLAKPLPGALLMAASAGVFLWLLGFNAFTLIPIVLLGCGALLGLLAALDRGRP